MKHKWIILAGMLLTTAALQAQDSLSLTLKEAVQRTLAYNKTLQLNKTKVEAAAAATREAYEKKLPEASISGSYLYLPIRPNISMKSSGDSAGSGNSPDVKQAIYGIASVSVPIYAGGRLRYGIESAKLLEKAAQLDADQDRDQVILNTVNACINLYKAYTAIGLVKENLATARQRAKDFANLEKNGLLARNDLMKAELQASNVELSLLDAETNYKLACVNMNLMMGTAEQALLIPDKTGLALPTDVKNFTTYEEEALKGRKDRDAFNYRQKAAELDVKSTKAGYYPTIAATAGYVAADLPGFLSITNAVNVGIGIKYDLASLWKTKTKLQQAEIRVKQVKLQEEQLDDNIRLQVNQAYQQYPLSTKKIEVLEKAVEQATENYRITNNKYNNALATTTELLDADVALLQSKLAVTNAKADSFLAYHKLLQVSANLNY